MIPQDASKSQRAVSQLLIAKESRRDKSRAQPEISGHGPDGGLRNSAADYHQTSEAISGGGDGLTNIETRSRNPTSSNAMHKQDLEVIVSEDVDEILTGIKICKNMSPNMCMYIKINK